MFGKFFRGGILYPEDGFRPRFGDPLRQCEVDGKLCRFHRFVEEDRLLLRVDALMKPEREGELRLRAYETGVVPSCCKTEVLRETRALIEWPDGSLSTVAVERVTFLDQGEG